MTKEDVNTIYALYELKDELIKKRSIALDMKTLFENMEDKTQMNFNNGVLHAYEQTIFMITDRIAKIRGIKEKSNE